jgi:hypothetical protein
MMKLKGLCYCLGPGFCGEPVCRQPVNCFESGPASIGLGDGCCRRSCFLYRVPAPETRVPTNIRPTDPTTMPASAPGSPAEGTPLLIALVRSVVRYVRDPAVLLRVGPKPMGSSLAPLPDTGDKRMPAPLLSALDAAERNLVARGFAPPLRASNSLTPTLSSCVSLVEHPLDGSTGFIMLSMSKHRGASMMATFATRFADGWKLTTSNSSTVLRTPSRPKIDNARFTAVRHIGALYDIHRRRVAERARKTRVIPTTRGADPIAYEDREAREGHAFWIRKGYYRAVGSDQMQMTPLGATLAAWRGLFPWKQITESGYDRKARAVLKRLGAPAPD